MSCLGIGESLLARMKQAAGPRIVFPPMAGWPDELREAQSVGEPTISPLVTLAPQVNEGEIHADALVPYSRLLARVRGIVEMPEAPTSPMAQRSHVFVPELALVLKRSWRKSQPLLPVTT